MTRTDAGKASARFLIANRGAFSVYWIAPPWANAIRRPPLKEGDGMLKKRKDMENGDSTGSGTSFAENSYMPGSNPDSRDEKTIIGEQISIEGSIHGKENLLIEGSMKGKIELEEHQVIVGSKGQVEAEIHAKDVTISGRMTGNIQALGKVEITRAAEFNGEVKAKRISVEDGAYIRAVIELDREDKKKTPAASKPDLQVASPASSQEPIALSGGADKGK
jgi:cytoskeletal protein CcmA (bactofilin family)